MAAVPIVLVGTIKDNDSGEEKQVTITGMAAIQGLHPAHPIPPNIWPDPSPKPPGYWGPLPGFPTPPIANVPGIDNPDAPQKLFDWKVAWSPESGWVVVGVPQFEHPVPSK